VTATVTDAQGRFVPGLTADDFEVYEDGKLQTISQFESERVPVSLGIALDTSGSMAGERMAAAQGAVNRFLYDLLGEQDEVFLYRFDSRPVLVHGWTDDRRSVGRALGSLSPNGGTAMYDTVAEAMPLFQSGTRRKKALVVISDGNDTSSRTDVAALRAAVALGREIGAVVSRGGRVDLAEPVLGEVRAPTLLIVGENDDAVLELNRRAYELLQGEKKLAVVAGATHLFEEPGALEEVARLSADWFKKHLRQVGPA